MTALATCTHLECARQPRAPAVWRSACRCACRRLCCLTGRQLASGSRATCLFYWHTCHWAQSCSRRPWSVDWSRQQPHRHCHKVAVCTASCNSNDQSNELGLHAAMQLTCCRRCRRSTGPRTALWTAQLKAPTWGLGPPHARAPAARAARPASYPPSRCRRRCTRDSGWRQR